MCARQLVDVELYRSTEERAVPVTNPPAERHTLDTSQKVESKAFGSMTNDTRHPLQART